MQSRLPSTPLEALSISGALRAIVKTIHLCADIFGFWNRPSKKAAGDFEDMSLIDKIYWGYKSKKPITRLEKGSQLQNNFKNNGNVQVPGGFTAEHSVTLGAAGDLIKVDGLEHSTDILYEGISDLLFEKDITYANLESQLTSRDAGSYTFSDKDTPPLCCTAAQYDALKAHKGKKLSLMHTACNHTLDMELEGLETTLEYLQKDGIADLGTNRRESDMVQGRVIEKNGIKIGFVSATYGLNGKPVPQGKEWMVNVVKFHRPPGIEPDLSLLYKQIGDCKEKKCDIIVGSLHWGFEYEHFPRDIQVDMAHKLVEAGVDVIIGHHTHVVQPVEYFRPQRDPSRTAVIAYSLGNLTSSFSAPYLLLSGILQLTIVKGTLDGEQKTLVQDVSVSPVVQCEVENNGKAAIRLQKLESLTDTDDPAGINAMKKVVQLVWQKS